MIDIVFDIDIEDPEKGFGPNGNRLITDIKLFVEQRLSVLRDQIEKENGTIVVQISVGGGLLFTGFSDELIIKMKNSLTEQDFIYFLASRDYL